ncbi:hypothetical protein NX722_27330 [Endozoicomonas gorgoniicola]|uniref:Tetratricopeptide repeat protein n=1 Tax=Endozoicomonas gorgoniicola TaxID=1234144 RepID=A0ABT3N3R4_9GAMM|nr:tetratricopeptide repeat protein [Endozoicomonas gorgoniicola]MCW7556276.1 hypothetical protein [Endozoicomonas gorgoniicola]
MNWKNKWLLLTLILCATSAVSANMQQRYQQLGLLLQKDPVAALPLIERFKKQHANGSPQAQKAGHYLLLQACITLQKYACATEESLALLTLPVTSQQKLTLYKLTAQLLFQQKQYQQSLDYAKQWLDFTPNTSNSEEDQTRETLERAQVATLAAYGAYHTGQLVNAIDFMVAAIALEQTEQRQLFLLTLYEQRQMKPEAESLLRTLVHLYPDNPLYWERLGYNLYQQDKSDAALNVLSSAFKAHRLPLRSVTLLARLLLNANAPARAAVVLEQNLDRLGEKTGYRSMLAQAYLLSRQQRKALKLLNESNDSSQKNTLALRSQLAYSLGHWPEAIQFLEQQIKKEPENQYWLLLQSLAYYENNQLEKARTLLEKVTQKEYLASAQQWISQIDYLTN